MKYKLKTLIENHGTISMFIVIILALITLGACLFFGIHQQDYLLCIITFGTFWLFVELLNFFLRKILGITEIKTRWG